jgi:hypothetical protein
MILLASAPTGKHNSEIIPAGRRPGESGSAATPAGGGYGPQDYYQAALVARGCGFNVFPLKADKRPLGRWKQWQTRRPPDHELARMFVGNSRVGGLGVVLGSVSGFRTTKTGHPAVLACRDFDDAAGYERWSARRPELAATLPTVRTRRGFHVYCRLWGDEFFHQLPDGDLRADSKHYAVLPPSLHPLGGRYRWLSSEPIGWRGVPVLTLSGSGFLDGYRVRSRSISTATQPTTRRTPEEPPNGFCSTGGRWQRSHTTLATHPVVTQKPLGVSSGSSEGLGEVPAAQVEGGRLSVVVREAVLRTQPRRGGERNNRLLLLARSLKDIAPGVRAGYWRDAVREWHRLALRVVGTKEWEPTWLDFRHAWEQAETPMSASRPMLALSAGVASAEGRDNRVRLMAGCRALAAEVGELFALSVRTAATALDVSPKTAHRLLTALVDEGHLLIVRKGEPSATRRVPTLYRLPTERR